MGPGSTSSEHTQRYLLDDSKPENSSLDGPQHALFECTPQIPTGISTWAVHHTDIPLIDQVSIVLLPDQMARPLATTHELVETKI